MNPRTTVLSTLILMVCAFLSCKAQDQPEGAPKKVVKTDQEWAKQLTREQFLVTRRKATEPAFSGRFVNNHSRGVYTCVCCDQELFSSGTKFISGTGWPSFYAPLTVNRIATAMDFSAEEPRVEVECSRCAAHLGHVFSDGPPPTGLRYCINSLSLKFVRAAGAAKTKAGTKTAKGKAKSKSAPAPSSEEANGGETTKPESDSAKSKPDAKSDKP